MRISDWSSDVCSSDLLGLGALTAAVGERAKIGRLVDVEFDVERIDRDDGGERRRRLAAGNQIAAGDENLADPARAGRFAAGLAKVERRETLGRTPRPNPPFQSTHGPGLPDPPPPPSDPT